MQGDTGRGGEAADVPGDLDLIRLFRAATAASDRFAERFGASHGLHRTDLNALEAIMDAARRGAPMSPSVLAAETGLSPSATTALIDRLESSGHVERVRTGGDRRRVTLAMSEAAFEGGRRMFAPLGRAFGEAWSDFSDEERRTVARFLSRSTDAMRSVLEEE